MNKVFVGMQNLYSDRRGITGLETAIILIAFIVVAAVFAFTVMTTGLFSTEKAKTTAQAGINQASSTFAPKGAIVAQAVGARVQTLFVQLQPATGSTGSSINRADLAFIYVDKNQRYATDGIITEAYDAGPPVVLDERDDGIIRAISIRKIVGDAALPNLLQEGEVAEITITLNATADALAVAAPQRPTAIPAKVALGSNTEFSIEIIPSTGGSLIISRKTPPELSPTMNLQ